MFISVSCCNRKSCTELTDLITLVLAIVSVLNVGLELVFAKLSDCSLKCFLNSRSFSGPASLLSFVLARVAVLAGFSLGVIGILQLSLHFCCSIG